jgi:hypothetical protein
MLLWNGNISKCSLPEVVPMMFAVSCANGGERHRSYVYEIIVSVLAFVYVLYMSLFRQSPIRRRLFKFVSESELLGEYRRDSKTN